MKRKLLSLILTLTMALTLAAVLPAAAANETVTTALDFTNAATCAAYATETNGILWDKENNSLTLRNATISVASGTALKLPSYTDVQLIGDNTITVGSGATSIGIYVSGRLYLQNSGSLTITTGDAETNSVGIMTGDLDLENCTVTARAGKITGQEPVTSEMSCGVYTSSDTELENAHLTVSGTGAQACAIYCYGDLTLDSDSTLTASHDAANCDKPAVKADTINALGATVNAQNDFQSGKTSSLVMPGASTPVTIAFPNIPDICTVGGKNYKNLQTAVDAAADGGTVTLTADVTLDKTLILWDSTKVTLDLNGHLLRCIASKYVEAVIENQGTLIITDSGSAAENKWVADSSGLWSLDNDATGTAGTDYFTTSGGCISGGKGAVGIVNYGVLNFTAGNIVGCCGVYSDDDGEYISHDGGGIYVSRGTVALGGGRICGNSAQYGGGVYVSGGTVTLSGGSIDRNCAGIDDLGDNMTRGGEGGGVMLMSGTLTVSGGSIDQNRAGEYGGGVAVSGGAALTMTAGTVSANSAGYGGGVYISGGAAKLSGGSITGNTATESGGGICLTGDLTVGGSVNISGNKVGTKDGNIYLCNRSVVTVGNGTNGVAAPNGMTPIGVSTNVYSGSYAVTAAGSGDSSAYFKADSFGYSIRHDAEADNVLLAVSDYALYLKDGKAYKNNAGGADVTADCAAAGLSCVSGTWKMDGFRFTSTAAPAVIFADNSATLSVAGTNYIVTETGEAPALTANNLTVTADTENARLYTGDVSATALTVTGKAVLTVYGNVVSQSRPDAYASPLMGDGTLGWDAENKTYTGVEYGLFLSKLIPFNGCFGNEDCTFDSYTYGQVYQPDADETEYTFVGWYPDGDYTAARLTSAEAADPYVSYLAKWLETKTVSAPTVEEGLVTVDAPGAELVKLPSAVINMTSLQVELANGTVQFNSAALQAIQTNAESGNVVLTVETPDTAADAAAYAKALSGGSAPKILSVSMNKDTLGGIAVFGSGNADGYARITVPYEVADGGYAAAYCLSGGRAEGVSCGYDRTQKTVTLTLSHFSEYVIVTKYDDSESSYPVSAAADSHGTLSTSVKNACAGQTVTVTVTPDKGWTLETLTVTDKTGKTVAVTPVVYGEKYTFRMPSGAVSVSAAFMEDNTMLNYFFDVTARDYYYDAVLWAAENGVAAGVGESRFAPGDVTTRAQMVTFLWRAAGSPVVNYAMAFTDVDADAWYAEAVRWAAAEGITSGATETTFAPDALCTRAQAVSFLWRYAGSEAATGGSPFTDVAADAYYGAAVQWAKAKGITSGTTETTFAPDALCTRAQIVSFLYRAFI